MRPVKLGIVGYGWFAELLARTTFPAVREVKVVGVCEPDTARREAARARFNVPVFPDVDGLLRGSGCEALAILTPNDTHRLITEAGAAAGCHVFCEKAMAVTVEDCLRMIEATTRAGTILMVGHKRRLRPPYARVAELVQSGSYGRPIGVNVFGFHWAPVFPGWYRRKASCGGLLFWAGVHDLDTMRFVVGREVASVYAAAMPQTDGYTDYEDGIAVTLRFEDETIGTLQVTPHDPLREFDDSFAFSVVCESGAVRYDPALATLEHGARRRDQQGRRHTERFLDPENDLVTAYRREFANFGAAVRGIEEPLLSAENGLRVVEIMQGANRSLETGESVTIERASVPPEGTSP